MPAETPPGLMESDFDTIHAAVMETARGRWFLAEYARRNRMADTRMVLDAVARLEAAVAAGPAPAPAEHAKDALGTTAAQIASRLSDIGWDLRERGFADDICAAVERQAAAVQGLARRLESGEAAPEAAALKSATREGSAPPLETPLLAAPERVIALPEITPSLRASMHAALSHLDSLPLATRLEMFV